MAVFQHGMGDDVTDRVAMARTAAYGFDDIDTNDGQDVVAVPAGYAGLDWSNFYVENGSSRHGEDAPRSGYIRGVTSGEQVAFTGTEQPVDITLSQGRFSLTSVEMTAAWDRKVIVEIDGYRNGKQLYHEITAVNDRHPTLVDLTFKNVDDVRFMPLSGTVDPKQPHSTIDVAFDDFVFGSIRGTSNGPMPVDALPHAAVGGTVTPHFDFVHAVHPMA